MNLRVSILLLLSVISCYLSAADQKEIMDLMKQEDYIKASLVVVSPGEAIYSAGGHLALRMSCPVQGVDYTYEFDALLNDDESLIFDFLNGKLQGEYVRLYSSDFFNKVRSENRLTDEYPLNLTPDQEVMLWSDLDNAVDAHSVFSFSPSENNCCSMILSIVDSSAQTDILSSPDVSDNLKGSGRKYHDDFFSNSPWTGLLWNILLGVDFDKPHKTSNLYYPEIIGKYIPLIKNPANNKPLIDKDSKVTVFKDDNKNPLTPSVLFLIIFLVSGILTYLNTIGKAKRVSYWFDILLSAIDAAIGCVIWYMFFASILTDKLYVNLLMLIFTPIPVIMLFIRKANFRLRYLKTESAISVILLIAIWFIPQLQLYGLWMLIAAMLIREIYYIFTEKGIVNVEKIVK